MFDLLREGSFDIAYCDTDSITMGLTDSLERLVKPGKEQEWADFHQKTFVQNETAEETRNENI